MQVQNRSALQSSTVLSRRTALLSALALPFVGPAAAHGATPVDNDQSTFQRISYNDTVLDDQPCAFWTMGHPFSSLEADMSGHGHRGRYVGSPKAAALPNGERATVTMVDRDIRTALAAGEKMLETASAAKTATTTPRKTNTQNQHAPDNLHPSM